MKTNNKPNFKSSKGGAPDGQRNGNHRGHGKRKESFFQPVSKSDSNAHSKNKGGGTGDRPSGKHGHGVHKTVAFKPKHKHPQGKKDQKPMSGNNSNNNGKGHPQNRKQQHRHQQHGNKQRSSAPTKPPAPSEIRFDSKPEKVNYCLAPERLEAQSRAIKQFEQKEREEEIQRKKQDRQQKHKMMTQKTRKGQPVMQGRLELLYEKVKKVVGVQ